MFSSNGTRLTDNAIHSMFNQQPLQQPILQIVDVRRVQNQSGQERCRAIVSDGVFLMQAMLATQITEGGVENLSLTVIRVNDYTVNNLNNKRFAVITNMEILDQNNAIIGDPKHIDPNAQQGQGQGQGQGQPQQQQQQNNRPQNTGYQNQGNQGYNQNQNQGGYNQGNNQGYNQGNNYNQNQGNNYNQGNNQGYNQNQGGNNYNNNQNQGGNRYQQGAPRNNNQNQGNNNGPVRATGAAVGGDDGDLTGYPTTPLNMLSPYVNRWCIKVRVASKGEVRNYKAKAANKSDGKLMSCTLVDEAGEIRCTMFNDLVDKFVDVLQEGQCYLISKGQLKPANREYSSVKNNYEITFDRGTTIQPIAETGSLPGNNFNFKPIAEVQGINDNEIIDVIGILTNLGDVTSITTKRDSKQIQKRNITIEDMSGASIEVSLWGDKATQAANWVSNGPNPVVAVKGAKVSSYSGKSLGTVSTSVISLNPDNEHSYNLRGWFDTNSQNGRSLAHMSLSSNSGGSYSGGSGQRNNDVRRTFADLKEATGQGDTLYSVVKGSINFLKHEGTMHYFACPNPDCKNKKVDPNTGSCNACNQQVQGVARYILSIAAADHSGQCWLSIFNDVGEMIFGMKAGELLQIKDNDTNRFAFICEQATFKSYLFKIRSKVENYNGEDRLKHTVSSAEPLDPVSDSTYLMNEIAKFQQHH